MKIILVAIFLISHFIFPKEIFAKESHRFEIQVNRKPVIEVNDIENVKAVEAGAEWDLSVRLTKEGSKKFAAATKKNIGQIMDIVIQDQIRSSPTIRAEIKSGELTITGNFSAQEAKSLAAEFSKKPTQK